MVQPHRDHRGCGGADFNLSVATYVERPDNRKHIDIAELNARIAQIVERENQLRRDIDSIIAELEQTEDTTELLLLKK